jgi:hypothetical protein
MIEEIMFKTSFRTKGRCAGGGKVQKVRRLVRLDDVAFFFFLHHASATKKIRGRGKKKKPTTLNSYLVRSQHNKREFIISFICCFVGCPVVEPS